MATIVQQAHLKRLSAQHSKPADEAMDSRIRQALVSADQKGKLDVVAAVIGVQVKELRQIMTGTEPLSLMHRYALGVHLGSI